MDPDTKDFLEVLEQLQSQNTTWRDAGFSEFMTRRPEEQSMSGFLSQDYIDSIFEGVSASKAASGIQRSTNGIMEINWDEGYIKVNFPGNVGYLRFGFVGTDNSGNRKFGTLLNDGTTNRAFDGV